MTRKCVLCKETNYRNTYSFFSAPKDPELRKKWQDAIAIENYCVTDDTYVCSKHFHKDDIITHWVSGVPPHVVTIKYKKCRLRPGAVPGRNYHLEENTQSQEHSDDFDVNINCYSPYKSEKSSDLTKKERDFLIPRTEGKIQISYNEDYKISSLYELPHKFVDYNHTSKRNSQNDTEFSENGSNVNNVSYNNPKMKDSSKQNSCQTKQNKTMSLKEGSFSDDVNLIEDVKVDEEEGPNQTCKEDFYSNASNKVLDSSFKSCDTSNEDDESMSNHKIKKEILHKEKSTDNNFNSTENIYVESQTDNLNYDELDNMYNDADKNEMLFEDLLEVCTEVLLPRGWSCLVTSKGRTTTIVYLYMGMTKSGMPFAEKQVFIKSDMVLHCAAVNKEFNPLLHNLIREGKHLKVQNLIDIEELIDEFDQRIVCQGIYDIERFKDINYIKNAYKDGIKWRHVSCPLLVNNDLSRCTRCISLSHTLQDQTKSFFSFPCNRSIFITNHSEIHSLRQKSKRIRKRNHKYEFVKILKQ
nr:PREDICTED: uncharacterized protein LOC100881130 isoform X1 [Megachile rotundata]